MYFIKVKIDPNLGSFQKKVQGLLDGMMNLNRPVLSYTNKEWSPEADMCETEEAFYIFINLAGVKKKNISVYFHKNLLRIEGKRIAEISSSGALKQYHQLEMGHGKFSRDFYIPTPVKAEEIEATYRDGLLTVKLLKEKRVHNFSLNVNSI